MHKYLRAIGFSEYNTKKDIDDFFLKHLNEENLMSTYTSTDGRRIGQYRIFVCHNASIHIIGEDDNKKIANIDFYYPMLKGHDYSLIQECTIEKHSDKDSFAGVIDDYRLGIALIFYLTNTNEYNQILNSKDLQNIKVSKIFLSALSIEGKIILPLKKDKKAVSEFLSDKSDVAVVEPQNDYYDKKDNSEFLSLVNNDMSMYEVVTERYKKEDLYSIVDTSMIPYGVECDKYMIVAEILSVSHKINSFTNEKLVEMRVNSLGMVFNIMINEKDLIGEPKPGRRFRGVIWLQGEIEFLRKNK